MLTKSDHNLGVSEVIGFILIISLAVATSTFVVYHSTDVINGFSDKTEHNMVEGKFVELASTHAESGYNKAELQNTHIQNLQYSEGANVKIYRVVEDDSDVLLYDTQLNKLHKTVGDYTFIMENGAVYKINTDTGTTQVVSSPKFNYNNKTVTFPLLNVTSSNTTSFNNFSMEYESMDRMSSKTVSTDKIRFEITGETYKGWGNYFEESLNNPDITYNDETNTVNMTVGLEGEIYKEINNNIVAGGNINNTSNNDISGDIITTGDIENEDNVDGNITYTDNESFELDSYINLKLDSIQETGETTTITEGDTITSGTYYVDEIDLDGETVTFDAEEGPIVIGVEGDVDITNDTIININNTTDSNDIMFYVGGDQYRLHNGGPKVVVNDGHTGHHIVYGSSDLYFKVSQKSVWEGVLYAPSNVGSSSTTSKGGGATCNTSTVSACIGANSTVKGALITGNMRVGQSATISFDDQLKSYNITDDEFGEHIRPDIMHLHISTTNVELKK